ncbi:hypothetical protein [Streptomyces sp. NPDC127084]|uniref:hypothetical protein n=1 Tax=Streptomyces sp. NPDC127084 TaxID=3347133 RepID=UPI00364F881E
MHDILLGSPEGETARTGTVERFEVGGSVFWWLLPGDVPGSLDDAVSLDGHAVVSPCAYVRESISAALEVVATHPWAMELLRTYVTTFALTEQSAEGGSPLITSCSLPDFPLCVFFSQRAFVHIPPRSVASAPSARLAAENLYHEAVHQAVNHTLLSRELLVPGYSSSTSPKIPIYWRKTAGEERNREWELDRVLHAAAVYCHLMHWRLAELSSAELTPEERAMISQASEESVSALRTLCVALTDHIDYFTSEGALFVGRLVEASAQRSSLLEAWLHKRPVDEGAQNQALPAYE